MSYILFISNNKVPRVLVIVQCRQQANELWTKMGTKARSADPIGFDRTDTWSRHVQLR